MIIYEGTNNLVSGAFLKCFSILFSQVIFTKKPYILLVFGFLWFWFFSCGSLFLYASAPFLIIL